MAWLTTKEVSETLGVTIRTIQRQIKDKKFKVKKQGGKLKIWLETTETRQDEPTKDDKEPIREKNDELELLKRTLSILEKQMENQNKLVSDMWKRQDDIMEKLTKIPQLQSPKNVVTKSDNDATMTQNVSDNDVIIDAVTVEKTSDNDNDKKTTQDDTTSDNKQNDVVIAETSKNATEGQVEPSEPKTKPEVKTKKKKWRWDRFLGGMFD